MSSTLAPPPGPTVDIRDISDKHFDSAKGSDTDEKRHSPSVEEGGGLPDLTAADLIPNDGTLDPIYQAKARVLNDAMQEIGMGRYHWILFCVTGFGWFADNLWPVVTGLILVPILYEFEGSQGPYLKLGQNIGLLVGAVFWSFASDVWGRRWAFNLTLAVVGIFGIAAAGSLNFTTLSSMAAVWSIGVGGNLPVDSAIFLEFVPGSHQWLLTVLSVFWAFGQLYASLVAWPLIGDITCNPVPPANLCPRSENMGWRYFLIVMGGTMLLMWFIRFFLFHLHESPKYLMSRGRDAEAVAVIHAVAEYNGVKSSLTLADLTRIGVTKNLDAFDEGTVSDEPVGTTARQMKEVPWWVLAKRMLMKYDMSHIKGLYATKKLGYSTTLVIIIWALIGLAFPLFNAFITYFLQTRGADFGDGSTYITYRNQVILSVVGVPGSIIGGLLVEVPYIGRKGTLAISTILTGVFLLVSTTARSSNALLGWDCGYSFTSNLMYGVLYAYTPEIFPTKDRGTGNGLAASANRVFGIMSPIIALYANLSTSVPIWISGALFIVSGFLVVLLPYEPRGRASL